MPRRLSDTTRDAVLASVQAIADGDDDRSARAVAREHGVSHQYVGRVSIDAGLGDCWDRSHTKRATEARQVDLAAERAVVKARLLVTANDLLDQLDEPFTAYSFGGKDNTYAEHEFARPPVDAARNLMTSAAIALDKHVALHKLDVDAQQYAAVDAWLTAMMGDVAPGEPDPDEAVPES